MRQKKKLHIRSVLVNSLAGLFQFMKKGSGHMAVTGIEKEFKCLISITEEKDMARVGVEEDTGDETKATPEPVPTTRRMARPRETHV